MTEYFAFSYRLPSHLISAALYIVDIVLFYFSFIPHSFIKRCLSTCTNNLSLCCFSLLIYETILFLIENLPLFSPVRAAERVTHLITINTIFSFCKCTFKSEVHDESRTHFVQRFVHFASLFLHHFIGRLFVFDEFVSLMKSITILISCSFFDPYVGISIAFKNPLLSIEVLNLQMEVASDGFRPICLRMWHTNYSFRAVRFSCLEFIVFHWSRARPLFVAYTLLIFHEIIVDFTNALQMYTHKKLPTSTFRAVRRFLFSLLPFHGIFIRNGTGEKDFRFLPSANCKSDLI